MLVDSNVKCLICGSQQFQCIHKGTRDISDIDVIKCTRCGFVELSCNQYNTIENYTGGGMLINTYSAVSDKNEDIDWNLWVKETEWDDIRRYETLKELCTQKSVLEFGSGNGEFLKRIKNVASQVAGVELMDEARERLQKDEIKMYKSLNFVKEKYDVVCMFMVIEHLNNPDEVLKKLYDTLKPGGILICETPNADDALLSKYHCTAFADFTYWSEHVFLFTSDTLERLLIKNGFNTKQNTQLQRYSLANHLFWLSEGKPGGHTKWVEFNGLDLNKAYSTELVKLGIADTLWYVGMKA